MSKLTEFQANPTADAQTANKVQILIVDPLFEGQRIDNFLFTRLKGVPKSRIYRALRHGEFRVNKKRVAASYKLEADDAIRIPPLRTATPDGAPRQPSQPLLTQLEQCIIIEDKNFIIINKPAGVAVHGGSGITFGVIEGFRKLRPMAKFLELVHRLDRDTTGCLVMAKKPSILKEVNQLLADRQVEKHYLALVAGRWQGGERRVTVALQKNTLSSGERIVRAREDGKPATTVFQPLKVFAQATLVMVKPLTGRTHQIRVHAAEIGHPILGDDKYGSKTANKTLGVKRLLLHAAALQFKLPTSGELIDICACLDEYFLTVLRIHKNV
jgi:23S rRNA pseudouridine955/2504/2580 synthase